MLAASLIYNFAVNFMHPLILTIFIHAAILTHCWAELTKRILKTSSGSNQRDLSRLLRLPTLPASPCLALNFTWAHRRVIWKATYYTSPLAVGSWFRQTIIWYTLPFLHQVECSLEDILHTATSLDWNFGLWRAKTLVSWRDHCLYWDRRCYEVVLFWP